MTPALRTSLATLLALMLVLAPLASLAGVTVPDCAAAQPSDVPTERCCAGLDSNPSCAMGSSACMPSAHSGIAPNPCFDAPPAAAPFSASSQAFAPDTKPPKLAFV